MSRRRPPLRPRPLPSACSLGPLSQHLDKSRLIAVDPHKQPGPRGRSRAQPGAQRSPPRAGRWRFPPAASSPVSPALLSPCPVDTLLPSWCEAGRRAALGLAETRLRAPIPGSSQRREQDKALNLQTAAGLLENRGHISGLFRWAHSLRLEGR